MPNDLALIRTGLAASAASAFFLQKVHCNFPRNLFRVRLVVNRKNKWLKRGLWTLALLVVVGAGLSVMSYVMLRRTPDWYLPDTMTDAQRKTAAERLENMLIQLRNWGGKQHAAQVRAGPTTHAQQQAQTALSQKPDEAFTISFTDDELNAFFNKWADSKNRRAWFDQYVENPKMVIRGNQLIFVGNVKEMDMVVSLVFEPRLDDKGNLDLHLVHVLGGVLPLPDAMWEGKRRSVEQGLQSKLPIYQQGAEISPEGIANGDAGSAAMNQLLLETLQNKPAGAVIFIPIELQHLSQSLPVKITALSIHDHTLEMTAEQMSEEERRVFMGTLKGDSGAP
jgi:hypothetical protein